MGQNQPKVDEKGTDAQGSNFNRQNLKDRSNASFQNEHKVNSAYDKGGTGSKGNPGKPT